MHIVIVLIGLCVIPAKAGIHLLGRPLSGNDTYSFDSFLNFAPAIRAAKRAQPIDCALKSSEFVSV